MLLNLIWTMLHEAGAIAYSRTGEKKFYRKVLKGMQVTSWSRLDMVDFIHEKFAPSSLFVQYNTSGKII